MIMGDTMQLGIQWKAELIVANDRDESVDALACPIGGRLAAKRIINEITAAP